MSNIMSLKQIKNKPHRSAFDLSHRKLFTAKVGELLPVYFKECLPGDKFKIGLQSFTRTQPVNSAAYTRIKEYYDYFFVPYRLLWRYFDQFITQTTSSNAQFASSLTEPSVGSPSRTPYFVADDILKYLNVAMAVLSSSQNDLQKKLSLGQLSNEFGFGRAANTFKLLKYLGYGLFSAGAKLDGSTPDGTDNAIPGSFGTYAQNNVSQFALNAFPILAYQKICADYFRNTQWENNDPTLYNVDYLSGNSTRILIAGQSPSWYKSHKTMLDLQYCTWNRDLFTGVLPSPQFGDTATLGVGALPSELNFTDLEISDDDSSLYAKHSFGEAASIDSSGAFNVDDFNLNSISGSIASGKVRIPSQQISSFSVLALRQAEALQKWREISISGKQDYKDQIEKHFGVHVPSVRSNLCSWIGGTSSNIDISEVVNTNLADMEAETDPTKANIAGKGVGVIGNHENFTASEHGILMCIYHAVPLMDYTDTITDLYMFKGTVYDYAVPEFDSIGMQSLPGLALSPLFNSIENHNDHDGSILPTSDGFNSIGYVPRYIDYKTSVDVVTGSFPRSLKYWCAPMGNAYFSNLKFDGNKLNPAFFKCNPTIMNTIFAVDADYKMSSDTFLINSFHDIKVVRNLDYNGLPY